MAAWRTKETRKTLFRGLRVTFSKCSSPKMFSECVSVGFSIKTHLNYPARGLTTPLATVGRNRAPQNTQRVSQNSKIHHRHAFVKKFPEQWHFPRFCPIRARFGPSITNLEFIFRYFERTFHNDISKIREIPISTALSTLDWSVRLTSVNPLYHKFCMY